MTTAVIGSNERATESATMSCGPDSHVVGGLVTLDGVEHYRIDGVERMDPFLTTVGTDSDLWMFVSSGGALTAGRADADHAVFPYQTDDRLHRATGSVGPVTVVARTIGGAREVWRPLDRDVGSGCTRSIAKSTLGDRLVFEEHHADWALTFRAVWEPSDRYGWVRTACLRSHGADAVEYEVLDGLVDVMPAGVDAHTEQIRSNLADAYKRSESGPWGRFALYTLESLISDRAEPGEALTATAVWSTGFPKASLDLDERAVAHMVAARRQRPTELVTGRPGAYILRGPVRLPEGDTARWTIVVDTALDHADLVDRRALTDSPEALALIHEDVVFARERLRSLVAAADGEQQTADPIADAHHLSNVLFNSMRGGTFPFEHQVPVDDLAAFVERRNLLVADGYADWFRSLGEWVGATELRTRAVATDDPDLVRLVLEYLPLTFSRRHGDPSRPWNRFSIEVRGDDGERLLNYEGNWRDIFQNWEALLHTYPAYFVNVVAKFVNASTPDGYNPYRITSDGLEWEVPNPDDPWSHIGYWGDHQIVYLLRLLEAWNRFEPGAIGGWLDRPCFVYADVPYALADHESMVSDPRNTITYDTERADLIERRVDAVGADGRLVVDADGTLVRVGLLEKLLVPLLSKLAGFVPEGGIWMNTQRPEWNDANNALAGPGASMVTLYHLRRYVDVLHDLIGRVGLEQVTMSASVAQWLRDVLVELGHAAPEDGVLDGPRRRALLDALAACGAAHRARVGGGDPTPPAQVAIADVEDLCAIVADHLDRSIESARRDDGLFHSYNLVSFPTSTTAEVDHLGPMLEGQVAILSSGALDGASSLEVIDSLFASQMYRPDQDTFMLYPTTELRSFVERNVIADDGADRLRRLLPNRTLDSIVAVDGDDRLRFRSSIVNAAALDQMLEGSDLAEADRAVLRVAYEHVFDHASYTGRSGSMYGYEGIGSVYWHMVSKLLLATQETYFRAVDAGESEAVIDALGVAYRRVRGGLGFCKSPAEFGAIPTDCYSHTPMHAGAQQPGMTGQVKEEVLTRLGELGLRVTHGCVSLSPGLLPLSELVPPGDRAGGAASASFTFCAVPMTLARGEVDGVNVVRRNGHSEYQTGLALAARQSQELFARSGTITRVEWTIGPESAASPSG